MTIFEEKYFQKFTFTEEQQAKFIKAGIRDLRIAEKSEIPEVVFKFSYDALIKFGITCIAQSGYKARSVPGHHVKILEKMEELLGDEDIGILGGKMRQMRNFDFYDGGIEISEKESIECLSFVKRVAEKATKFFNS